MSTENGQMKESLVVCLTNQGVEIRALLMRLTRYQAVLEIYNPGLVLRSSEVLQDFKIIIQDRTIYSGRAVVTNLVNTGSVLVCEVKLDEAGFIIASFVPLEADALLRDGFNQFLGQWQKVYKVLPEFKVVVADMQTFLADMRLWLDQVELEIRSMPHSGSHWTFRISASVRFRRSWCSRLMNHCSVARKITG